MKKKIAIIGSTGSIGISLLSILNSEKKNIEILLLTANKSYNLLLKQAKKFKVKNLIITDKESFKKANKINNNLKLKIYNDFNSFNKIFFKKVDYTMSSITGIDGLEPTIKIIKHSKKIAIANKESIICGWNLIKKELRKNSTKFIPVDSEHFSLWYGLKNKNNNSLEKIYLTASGGPLYKINNNKMDKVTVKQALKHPNWKMGKKISIDSATLINKVYEVIEAKNIFDISYKNINILIHPKSYVHALIKFNNGLIKIIAHETTMRIPIFNTLYTNEDKKFASKQINIKTLNNLDFKHVDAKKFPMVNLIKYLPKKNSLYETVIVSANDILVELFLKNKIKFTDIQKNLFKLIKSKEFIKYKKIYPKKINDIIKLNNYVRLKILKKVYKSLVI